MKTHLDPRSGEIDSNTIGMIGGILAAIFFVLIPLCSGSDKKRRTDGVYESATEKMDKGVPLNDRETKRINDILEYGDKKRAEEIERRNHAR